MNRFQKFVRTVPMKIYLLILAVLLISFFSNDFGLVDIQKTAVILAAGVDTTETGYVLTTQIAVPMGGGSGGSGGSTASITLSAEGDTVASCITRIYTETGWVPKLVFCNLVVLGEEAAKKDAIGCFDFFLRNEYMSDNCNVAVCEGTAKDLLSSNSAMDDTSALAIGKLFSDAAQKSGKVMPMTLREFSVDYYSVSASGYMPYIVTCNRDETNSASGAFAVQTAGGGQEQSGGSGGSNGNGEEGQPVVYCTERTAIFQDGKMVGLFERDETFALSLLEGKVFAGQFTAEEDGKIVALSVLKNSGSVELDAKNNPQVKVEVTLKVRLYNRGVPVPVNDLPNQKLSEELQQSAKNVIEGYVGSVFEICRESGCDLFKLREQLYRSSLKKYAEWKELVPNDIETTFKTTVVSVK